MTGHTLGTYELEGLLGEGGIGQVYAAQDTVLGRKVAIKMLRPEFSSDRNFVERFYVEAKSLGNLNHTNITTIYALHTEGAEAYMVMELVHGYTLEALLQRVQRLTLRDSLAVLAQAVAGMRYAHRRGVIHRDLKPANLMVTDDGLVKIMDFGIARVRGSEHLTRVGEFCGTFVYASPEQIRGEEVDERSDLYSLAIVLYRMLAGVPPFASDNEYALMTAQLQTPPPPLVGRVPDLDAATEEVLMRALAKRPEDRFASIEEFGKAIGAMALRGDSVEILTQLYARAFEEHEDPKATRIVSSSRFSRPAADPTAPSNRRDWQLPTIGSRPNSAPDLVMSRRAAVAPASRPNSSPFATPAPSTPVPPSFQTPSFQTPSFQPSAFQPAVQSAKPRSGVRPWLIGVSALAMAALLGGGYYFVAADKTVSNDHQVAVVIPTPPAPAKDNPADTVPPPSPVEVTKVEPAPEPVEIKKPEPAPVVVDIKTPEPAPVVVPVEPPKPEPAPVKLAISEPAPVDPPQPRTSQPPSSTQMDLPQPEPVPPPLPVVQPTPDPVIVPAPPPVVEPVKIETLVEPVKPVTPPPVVTIPEPPKPELTKPEPGSSSGNLQVATVEPPSKTFEPLPVLPPANTQSAKPEGQPDLFGKVSGAKGLDEIEIGGRWIKVYGIIDNARGAPEAQHVQALIRYIKPAGNILVCYRKAADTYRCYADGQDIAQLALLDGLVRLAPNAPAEYRTLLAQKR